MLSRFRCLRRQQTDTSDNSWSRGNNTLTINWWWICSTKPWRDRCWTWTLNRPNSSTSCSKVDWISLLHIKIHTVHRLKSSHTIDELATTLTCSLTTSDKSSRLNSRLPQKTSRSFHPVLWGPRGFPFNSKDLRRIAVSWGRKRGVSIRPRRIPITWTMADYYSRSTFRRTSRKLPHRSTPCQKPLNRNRMRL